MKMLRLLLAAALILASFEQALAGVGLITTKDAAGVTRTFTVTTDAGGQFIPQMVLCDATAAAACAGVDASGLAVKATQTGTWNVTNISGTVSLPTGAATSALQTTGNTSLTTINTTLGSPFQAGASIGNTTFAATQATSSNLKAQVDPLTAASWGIGTSTQNSASVANGHLVLGQFNTAPTTISSGNMSALQMDNAGKLLVNCTGCSSSSSITSWGGGTLGAMGNYGTSPGAVLVPGVNAFVTNTNANGQATAANSSPVVLPVAQVTADPCSLGNKTNLPISQNGTSSVQLVGLSGSTVIYVCSLSLIAAGATTVILTTGTGSACVTGNAAVIGDTTANIANGLSLAANGGLTLGSGAGTIAKGAASSELCMTLGTNVRMSGNLTYVQQ